MSTLRLKHNPSHMPEDELIRGFVVRQRDLAAILETVRENTGASNQHLLILGPRGMGKTTLVNRAVAEIRRDSVLSQSWYPILFDEESYTVTSAGELWLQALVHLADQTQSRELDQARRALQTVTDRDRLRDAALARLLEFADAQGKRLLLVFENIDMIFDEQLTDDDAWDLRHTFQNEPRIMALATSTTRLESFHDSDKPLYELFREHTLERLDLEECRTVWRLVTGAELPPNQARPIQIFTGGNTRLLTILGTFAKDRSFRELMDDLVGLIDENTPYFKANVEALPKESRKIFVTLADLWSPATARQVADQMRGDVRAVSAQLGRLEQQGIVEVARRVDKTMMYQVSERMYNLYRLLRSRGSARVRAVVEFIIGYYDQDGMQRFLASLASEACDLGLDRREDHVRAYCELMRRIPDHEQRNAAINDAPPQFREIPEIARLLQELTPQVEETTLDESELRARLEDTPDDVALLVQLGHVLSANGATGQALQLLDRALALDDASADVVNAMVYVLYSSSAMTSEVRLDHLRNVVARASGPATAIAYPILALALAMASVHEEAREMANEALARCPDDSTVGFNVGCVFEVLGDRNAAVNAYMHALDRDPSSGYAVVPLSRLLIEEGRIDEAEGQLRRCLSLQPREPAVWIALIALLKAVRKDPGSALRESRKAAEFNPDDLKIALEMGFLLNSMGQQCEAEQAFRRIVVDMRSDKGLRGLVLTLIDQGKIAEAHGEVMPRLATSEDPELHLAAAAVCLAEKNADRCHVQLRRVLELDPQNMEAAMLAVSLCMEVGDIAGGRRAADDFIDKHPLRLKALRGISSFVLSRAVVPLYPDVVVWAREIINASPNGSHGSLLLAGALARTHAWEGVWSPLEVVLADELFVQRRLRDVIELVSLAAACGHAVRASSLLAASASAARMEPLLVALRRIAGEATNPPQEVSEVADDIVRDIERMREALLKKTRVESSPAAPGAERRRHRSTRKGSRNVENG
ncbi:MAG: AAA family ATPase [Nannocystis sp.]|nr:ATP-binding protein [Nannocystis sp.]MBA3547236.1 AAA family ATPase [Nannocystis sp.]